jgi:hypothetical protein
VENSQARFYEGVFLKFASSLRLISNCSRAHCFRMVRGLTCILIYSRDRFYKQKEARSICSSPLFVLCTDVILLDE